MTERYSLRPFAASDAPWIVARHSVLYRRDEGFDETFEPLVAEIVTGFLERHDPACERGWVATAAGGGRLGSIFCVAGDRPGAAKLRLFFLEPEARGTGLGRRMIETCAAFARQAGYTRLTLSTHAEHQAARALYRKTGFDRQTAIAVRAFGRDLVEEVWERGL